MAESIQKRLTRERPPRVKITYDVEAGGAIVKAELPFVMGVIADLSGDREGVTRDGKRVPGGTKFDEKEPDTWPKIAWQEYADRAFVEIDKDNFNDVLAEFAPRLKYKPGEKFKAALGERGLGELPVDAEIAFHHLNDFLPDSIVKAVNPLKGMLAERDRIRDLYTKMDMNGGLLNTCYSHVMDLRMDFGGGEKKPRKPVTDSISMDAIKQAIVDAVDSAVSEAGEGTFSGIGKTKTEEAVKNAIKESVKNAIEAAGSKAGIETAQEAITTAVITPIAESVYAVIKGEEIRSVAGGINIDTAKINKAVENAINAVREAAVGEAAGAPSGETRTIADIKAVRTVAGGELGQFVSDYFTKRKTVLKEKMKKSMEKAATSKNIEDANPRALIQALTEEVSAIDEVIAAKMNAILHDKKFQALEASWRGLFLLVKNTATSTGLKLKVLNAGEDELFKDLNDALAFDQSHLFKMVYEETYGTQGGNPYSCLLHDHYYGKDSVTLAKKMTEVAAAAHAPLLTAAAPGLFDLESFKDLAMPRDLSKIFESAAHTEWRSLREHEDSRYLTMCLPRILMRKPYAKADVASFEYEEKQCSDPVNSGHGDFLWGNAAYALGVRITTAFALYGWTAAIRGMEGGGLVEELPVHNYVRASGDTVTKIPTETAITDRREKELSDLGFISLCYRLGTDKAVFFGGQTVNKPLKYLEDDATANANLSARLPYMLNASRFAHYVKSIMRDKIGSFLDRGSVEKFLNTWLSAYVLLSDDASQSLKASYPLREGRVDVVEDEANPGSYRAVMYLRPHFQMEELTVSIRLVAKLPAPTV